MHAVLRDADTLCEVVCDGVVDGTALHVDPVLVRDGVEDQVLDGPYVTDRE